MNVRCPACSAPPGAGCRGGDTHAVRVDTEVREAVSKLRSVLQVARIFVEGKALTPDESVLLGIDHVLAETKKHALY